MAHTSTATPHASLTRMPAHLQLQRVGITRNIQQLCAHCLHLRAQTLGHLHIKAQQNSGCVTCMWSHWVTCTPHKQSSGCVTCMRRHWVTCTPHTAEQWVCYLHA